MPIIVGRAVHVHPLVTIFAVLTGEKIAGVLGMILAVPIAATIKVVLDYAYPPPMPHIELPREAAASIEPIPRSSRADDSQSSRHRLANPPGETVRDSAPYGV